MRVLATTGYYGSGSSAVTDLIKEYDNIGSKSEFEISFFFGYYGILNLYNWIVRWNRLQDMATESFLDEARRCAHFGTKMNYEKYFNGQFMKNTYSFVSRLQGMNLGSHYYVNFSNLNEWQLFIWRVFNKIHSIPDLIYNSRHSDRRETTTKLFARRANRYLYDVSEDTFLKYTKEYLENLLRAAFTDKDVVMVDGLIAAHNVDDIAKYFDDLRLVIVRRDPRDIYLLSKYVWKTGVVPEDVECFCKWFRKSMSIFKYEHSNVLNIQFEDLIFDYDHTVRKIESFYEIDSCKHVRKKKTFDPIISKNNCQLYLRYKNEESNCRYIEGNLAEYIYNPMNIGAMDEY